MNIDDDVVAEHNYSDMLDAELSSDYGKDSIRIDIKNILLNSDQYTDLLPFFDKCKTLDNFDWLRDDLKALHFVCWNWFNRQYLDDGRRLCPSSLTFGLCAIAEIKMMDTRTLDDFTRIKLDKRWIHEGTQPMIVLMSQQHIVSTLTGLTWNLTCDLFNGEHDIDFIEEYRTLFELLRSRVMEFIRVDKWRPEILNVKEYRDCVKRGNWKPLDTTHLDYDSDEEVYRQRNDIIAKDNSKHDQIVHIVNEKFIMDMDSIITSLEYEFYEYDTHHILLEVEQPSISKFRFYIFEIQKNLSEATLLDERRFWQEKISVSIAFERIYKRKFPTEIGAKRQIMIDVHEDLRKIGNCTSVIQLFARPGLNIEIMYRLATDSMFVMFLRSIDFELLTFLESIIVRSRIRNCWILKYKGRQYKTDSFTHGYRLYTLMNPNHKHKIDENF